MTTTTRLIDSTMDAGRTLKARARDCRIGHCGHPACIRSIDRRVKKALRGPTEKELLAGMPRFMRAMFPVKPNKPVPPQSMDTVDVGAQMKEHLRGRRIDRSFRNDDGTGIGAESRSVLGVLGDAL